ncbi:MAG: hypothetical protein NT167_11235 [Verrucomicrobia bacterium]|nr:hypothetical protein [Verrucomicrobiota bacterium]
MESNVLFVPFLATAALGYGKIIPAANPLSLSSRQKLPHAQFIKFTAQTRMSGMNLDGVQYLKGAADAIRGNE